MHPYFKNRLIGKIFFGLFLLSIVAIAIVPSGPLILLLLLLIMGFLVLSLVFLTKGISYNKKEEKILKERLVEDTKFQLKRLIGYGIVLAIIILVAILKYVVKLF